MFVEVMKDLKARRVRELLKGYPSLLLVFNAYVPNGYEIMLNDEDKASSKKTTNNEEECNLVKNIKKHLVNNHEYKSFLDIMNKCRKEHKDVKEVYHEVNIFFIYFST
ncbi:hypothetical protein MTR67_043660 [Solanum verrucosum]|uniref:Uncharacterized protein n=1 Tax=Solanum verrucosum TaxID=315347 RepID=A0AAF0UPG8_SOLVR|nr:hypothetical protein MTR67_043660 [Solanum verrucosum]